FLIHLQPTCLLLVFLILSYGAHRYLHSFPTRRSSDLINLFLHQIGIQDAPNWLDDTGWIYPALVFIGVWGIGGGIIINLAGLRGDRKSTRLNSSHQIISYAVFCLKKKTNTTRDTY